MNVRIPLALSLLSLSLFSSAVQGQDAVLLDQGGGIVTGDTAIFDNSGSVFGVTPLGVQGSKAWVRADVGERPGSLNSYYSAGFFMPIQLYGPESAFYVEGQGWVDENGNPGVDFGGGYRHQFDPLDSIIGVNGFFTFDNSLNENSFRRYGFGLEWLTEFVTGNANLYLPVDRDVVDTGALVRTNELFFSGQNLFFRNFQVGEQQMKGGDAELGVTIPQATWLSLFAGGYFYDSRDGENVNGFQGRAQFDLSSVIADISYANDSNNGSTVFGSVQYTLGPGIPQFQPRQRDFYSRMYDNVNRRRRVFLQNVLEETEELALRPDGNGQTPYTFIHVDNNNPGTVNGGDGTYENPFDTLDGANGPDGQIILVHRGNSSLANPVEGGQGLFLDDNQIIVGEGTPFALSFSNRPGFLPLPDFDSTGPKPFVTADNGFDVLTLANNNLVDGLNILAPGGGNSIAGDGVNNFTIRNINTEFNANANFTGGGGGIVLQNATGVGLIQNAGFRIDNVLADGGIVIENENAAPLNLLVDGAPFLEGGAYGVRLSADSSEITATLRNVDGDANGIGLEIAAIDGGDVSATVSNSTFTNSLGHGMVVRSATTGLAQLAATNVNASNASGDGLLLDANNSTSTAVVTGSNLSSAGRHAVNVTGTGATGVTNLQVVGTNGNAAAENGVNLALTADATATISLVNSTFDQSADFGFLAVLDDATANVSVNGTSFLDTNNFDAFAVDATNGATFNGTMLNDVNMLNAGRSAINLFSENGADVTLSGSGTGIRGANAGADAIVLGSFGANSNTILNLNTPGTFANAGSTVAGSGIAVQGDSGGNIAVTITGNPVTAANFQNASQDGVNAQLGGFPGGTGSATATINLDHANFSGADRDGLHVVAVNNSSVQGSLDDVLFNNAGDDAIFLSALSGADIDLDGNAVSGSGATDDGIDLRADGAGSTTQLTMTATGTFANPGDDGISLLGDNGGAIGINVTGGNFTQADTGLLGVLDNAATAAITLSNVTFNDAASDGMHLTANNGAAFLSNITGSSFQNAGDNALEIDLFNNGGAGNTSVANFTNTLMNDATVDSLNVVADQNSFLTLDITHSNISSPGDDVEDYTITNGSNVTVVIDPTNATGAGDNGIEAVVNTGSTLNVTHEDSDLSGAANNGVLANVTAGSTLNLTLDNSDVNNSGANGIDATVDGSAFNLTVTDSSISNSGTDGLDITLQNVSTGQFTFNNFAVDGNNGNGFALTADNSSVNGATFTNGTFNDNGVAGAGSLAGISITSLNGSQIGSRGGRTAGMTFTNVSSSNTVDNARTQDNGLRFRADSGGYLGLAFNDADLLQNEGNGVDGIVNEDLSIGDNALAIVGFTNGSRINDNHGDGAFLRAFNGSDVAPTPNTHLSGIVYTIQDSFMQQNGDGPPIGGYTGNPPQTGANGDGRGFGINAFADGDNSVAGNTQITLNILNSDLSNNEEGSINPVQQDGGVVHLNQVGGTFDLHHFVADGALDVVSVALDSVTLTPNANGPGFSLWSLNNGTILADFNNLIIENNGGVGIITLAETGGDIDLTLSNSIVRNNGNLPDNDLPIDTNQLAIAAIQSIVDGVGSNTNLTLDNVDIVDHAALNAFEAVIGFRPDAGYAADPSLAAPGGGTGAGTFTGTFTDVVSNNNVELATEGSLQVRADGANAVANLDIDTYTNEQANGSGANLVGTNGGTLNVTQFDNITLTNNTTDGVNVDVGTLQNFVANNVTVTGAGGVGVDINSAAGTGGAGTITLNNVTANNAAQGLDLTLNALAATDSATININNSTFNNATAGPGVNIRVDGADGSTATMNVNGLTANDSAGNGIVVQATGGLDLAVPTFNNVSATNAVGTGLSVTQAAANGNLTQFNMTTGNFNGSGNGAIIVTTNTNTATNISLTDVTANGPPAGVGVQVIAQGLAGTSNVNLTNVDALNRGQGAFVLTNASTAGAVSNVNVTGGSDFSTSTGVGLQLIQTGAGTTGNINVADTTIDNSANPLIIQQLGLTGGASTIALNNVSAQNSTAGSGALIQATGLGATDSVAISATGTNNFFNAAADGVHIDLNGAAGSTATLDLDGLNVSSAGDDGLDVILTGGVSAALNTLNNITATDAADVGVNLVSTGPSAITAINSNTMNVSNAQNTGLLIDITNQTQTTAISLSNLTANNTINGDNVHIELDNVGAGGTNTLAMNTVAANLAGDDGIDLALLNNTVLNITAFNGVTAQNNQENGLKIDVASGSSITNFVASGLDLSNNGTSGVGFDGLDIQVHGAGSDATFNLANLTINNSGGRGADVDAFDGGDVTFNVNGGTINNSGLGGLDINVGAQDEFGSPLGPVGSANFAGTLTNLNVTNSGTSGVFAADGVNVDVNGNGVAGGFGAGGVSANLTVTGGSSSSNDGDGYDFSADNGAVMNVAGSGLAASSNVGKGLNYLGTGATSVVSLNLTGANTFNGNLGASGVPVAGDGPGVDVLLTNGVTATNVTIAGTSTANDGDGVRIRANDGTGVTINNLDTSGVIANNNLGSGLVIDLNAVNGVNSFAMNNASFSGNLGDQVFAQFREMTLANVSFTNTTFTGAVGSGDGLDLRLIDSSVTGQFTLDNITTTGNGQNGVNLLVDEQVAGGNVAQIASGVVTHSQFSGNTQSGANMVFGGAGVNNLFIFENSTAFGPNDGFRNNGQSGLAMRIEDTATMNMTGANPINGAGAFYDNQFNGNGNIGFNFIANEPADVNPLDLDGIGPTYNLTIGDILRDPNEFTNNGEAGMALQGRNDSTGSVTFLNSVFSNNTNVAGGTFNGDGLAVRLEDNAILTDLLIDGTNAGLDVNNNAGSGLLVSINENSRLGTNTNLTILDTTISGNGRHGVEIERRDDALFGLNMATNQIIIGQAGALAAGTENQFLNNGLAGVFVLNENMPGAPIPLNVQMTENVFQGNQDGTFMQGTGNAQFTGALTDNVYSANTRDGARFLLENDAALGDPNSATGDPFLMAGNQITGNGRHGIFFDTNFTNETGLFTGGAYVNVHVTGGAVNARTLISGNGQNGIQIIDNSDFVNPLGTAYSVAQTAANPNPLVNLNVPVQQNTYRITSADITNNTGDGINAIQAQLGSEVDGNSGFALIVGDRNAVQDRRNVIVSGNGDDGIDLNFRDSDSIVSSLFLENMAIQNNGLNGDGENAAIATAGHGVEVDLTAEGRMFASIQNVDITDNAGDGMDFDVLTNQTGTATPVNLTMTGTSVSQNGERGLDARLYHDSFGVSISNNSGLQTGSTSIWNLGVFGGRANRFNENGREGIVMDLQATGIDGDTGDTSPNGPIIDNNQDIFIDTNIPFFQNGLVSGSPINTITASTNHAIVGGGLFGVPEETRRRVQATINLIDSQVANNGGFGGFEDGFDVGIGYLTRANVAVAGVSFGGNVGDDIRLYSQRSGTFALPVGGQNANPVPLENAIAQNFAIYDPVAYADVVLGAVDTNGDGIPDTTRGNGRAANFVDYNLDGVVDGNDFGGQGEQINIVTFGTTQTSQITNTGVVTDLGADAWRANNRQVILAGQIQIFPNFGNTTINDFFQNGVQQNIFNQFNFFNWNGATIYPDNTFPP